MHDVRRLGFFALVFFLLLRVSIGWQFLYEGMWKYNTLSSTKPWSAEGYLKSAKGPMREHYFALAGDGPYDMAWLDYDKMSAKWTSWKKRFENHYGLNKNQQAKLNSLVDGRSRYAAKLSALPEGVSLDKWKKAISYDAKAKLLIVDGKWHLTPVERERLFQQVPDVKKQGGQLTGGTEVEREFYTAVEKVYARQSRLGYREKLAASLKGDADRVGAIFESEKALKARKIDPRTEVGQFKTYGEIDKYKAMVDEYEQELANKKTQFDEDHLAYSWGEIQSLKSQLTGPVKALEAEMKLSARELLKPSQLARGTVPPAKNWLTISNWMTIAGLLILGICLMAGLFTRTAAIAGAFMLFSFYMVSPPWPGVPPAPGPEHALFVNKNLIEVVALLAIAFSSSGQWFGVDALVKKLLNRRKSKRTEAAT